MKVKITVESVEYLHVSLINQLSACSLVPNFQHCPSDIRPFYSFSDDFIIFR